MSFIVVGNKTDLITTDPIEIYKNTIFTSFKNNSPSVETFLQQVKDTISGL